MLTCIDNIESFDVQCSRLTNVATATKTSQNQMSKKIFSFNVKMMTMMTTTMMRCRKIFSLKRLIGRTHCTV